LYDLGGFKLPFLIIGSINTILSILLVLTIPSGVSKSSSQSLETNGDPTQTASIPSVSGKGRKLHSISGNNGDVEEIKEPLVRNSKIPIVTSTAHHPDQLGYAIIFYI
jgi:hypothetical protein